MTWGAFGQLLERFRFQLLGSRIPVRCNAYCLRESRMRESRTYGICEGEAE